MPTGYTADVVDGKVDDVKDFAAQCARGFGAFMHMRDESGNVELHYPESPYKSYYVKMLDAARSKRNLWNAISETYKYAEWSNYVKEQREAKIKSDAQNVIKRARYDAMLAQVKAIEVPADLENFKKFMVEQLEDSKKFDTHDDNDEWTENYYAIASYPEWCDSKSATVDRDVDYYSEQLDKEWERYEKQLAYIDQMVKTFGFKVKGSKHSRHVARETRGCFE